MNELFRSYRTILDYGINPKIDPINLARSRIINYLTFILISFSGLLALYRLIFFDFWDLCFPNIVLWLLMLIPGYYCTKGKQQIAFRLVILYILLFVFELNRPDSNGIYIDSFRTSIVVHLTLIPFLSVMLNNNRLEKHISYFLCLIIFNYFHYSWAASSSTFITYNAAITIFYIALSRFMDFVEQNQIQLEENIVDKTNALQSLKMKNMQLKQFSNICSHDLKEPIRSISSYSSLLKRSISPINNKQSEYFSYVNSSIRTMDKIVGGLKDFTTLDNPELYNKELINLERFFHALFKRSHSKYNFKTIESSFLNNTPITEISISSYAMNTVFDHLFQNSVVHNDSPIININILLNQKDSGYIFIIEDNGNGIDEKYTSYIFEPFKTMNNKTSTESAGLGLVIVKSILDRINGTVWFESNKGNGTKFYIKLDESISIHNSI